MSLNNQSLRRLSDNKLLFFEHCAKTGLPAIPVICHVGELPEALNCAALHIDDAEQFAKVLEAASPRLFVKLVTGSHGDGAFTVIQYEHDFEFNGRRGSASDLFGYLKAMSGSHAGFIIQPRVKPHPLMLPFASKNGLPTVRAVTVMTEDGPELLFACLKITVGTHITDNFSNGTSGNLVAGIDIARGTLTPARGSRRRHWPTMIEIGSHPDTGVRIAGSQVPFWKDVVDIVLAAQRSVPELKTVGWDVAITPDGVLLVELNTNYDMHILQVAYRRGLRAELSAKLGVAI